MVHSPARWFLDPGSTHCRAWAGDHEESANWFWYAGIFADYEENMISRMGAEAARPHRATHRKLTR